MQEEQDLEDARGLMEAASDFLSVRWPGVAAWDNTVRRKLREEDEDEESESSERGMMVLFLKQVHLQKVWPAATKYVSPERF